MAKRSVNQEFAFEALTADEAAARRTSNRTRRSKYSPIGDRFATLGMGTVLAFKATKHEVQGIRNYMRRNFEGEHQINSRRIEGEAYEVHLSKTA